MKKRIITLLLIICIAASLVTPALATPVEKDPVTGIPIKEKWWYEYEIDERDAWKIWSQTDERWNTLSISSQGYPKYNMHLEGCLITAITKIFIYAGQQNPDNFTPADTLKGMLKYGLLTSGGALTGGARMNTNGFLKKYAPKLTYTNAGSHTPWTESKAVSEISKLISEGKYIIVRVKNYATGNGHYMAVDRVEDGRIYVMDNKQIIDLYAPNDYGGIAQVIYFTYSGKTPYPAWDTVRKTYTPAEPLVYRNPNPEPETPVEPEIPEEPETPVDPELPVDPDAPEIPDEEVIPPEDSDETEELIYIKNFTKKSEYDPELFSDVPEDAWYFSSVANAYSLGLVLGMGDGKFGTGCEFALSGAVTIAARIHSIYNNGSADFVQGDVWYQVYVDYAIENGIIAEGEYDDFTRPATRGEMVRILSAALPDEALPVVNDLADGAIPDVTDTTPYADAAYRLYRAGILTGIDEALTLNGEASIKREEVSAIVARMAIIPLRQILVLPELDAAA